MAEKDNVISEAAAKLYACKYETLPVTSIGGEFSSQSIILPLDKTCYVDSANYPNAPPPSLRDSALDTCTTLAVSKQWWEELKDVDLNACDADSATPKNVITKNHQREIRADNNPGPTYLWLSIGLLVLWCVCLNPIPLLIQVPALILSLSAHHCNKVTNYAEAHRRGLTAIILNMVAAVLGLMLLIIAGTLAVLGVIAHILRSQGCPFYC